MRRTVVICDNCGAEVVTGKRGKDAVRMQIGYRALDLCEACGSGAARDLLGLPLDEWPRYVRREDVRAYLERALAEESNGSPSET